MNFDRNLKPVWRRGYRFQYEPAQNAHVLLYPEGMVKLNESASAIGSLIDGERSVAAIIDHRFSMKIRPSVPNSRAARWKSRSTA